MFTNVLKVLQFLNLFAQIRRLWLNRRNPVDLRAGGTSVDNSDILDEQLDLIFDNLEIKSKPKSTGLETSGSPLPSQQKARLTTKSSEHRE